MFADGGYDAQQTYEAATANHPLRREVVQHDPHATSFAAIQRRWVIERTFSWVGHNRRLSKDYETIATTVLAFVTLVAIQVGLRRLAQP